MNLVERRLLRARLTLGAMRVALSERRRQPRRHHLRDLRALRQPRRRAFSERQLATQTLAQALGTPDAGPFWFRYQHDRVRRAITHRARAARSQRLRPSIREAREDRVRRMMYNAVLNHEVFPPQKLAMYMASHAIEARRRREA